MFLRGVGWHSGYCIGLLIERYGAQYLLVPGFKAHLLPIVLVNMYQVTVATSQHDWKIVDRDVKSQNKQTKRFFCKLSEFLTGLEQQQGS